MTRNETFSSEIRQIFVGGVFAVGHPVVVCAVTREGNKDKNLNTAVGFNAEKRGGRRVDVQTPPLGWDWLLLTCTSNNS